jgi:hypothetical protein
VWWWAYLWAHGLLWLSRNETLGTPRQMQYEFSRNPSLSLFSIPIDSFDLIVVRGSVAGKRVLQIPLLLLTLAATSHL